MFHTSVRVDRRQMLRASAVAGALTVTPVMSTSRMQAAPATLAATPAADALETVIAETVRTLGVPGAIVLVDRPGMETWSAGFGVSDLESQEPMRPDMQMRIGSVTKTMTATVALQLVDEGLVGLDDTLATVAPSFSTFPNAAEITVRQLLNHTSGVFDLLDDESVFVQIASDPARKWTPEEIIDISASHAPESAPGAEFHYSNTNYIILGLLIEHVTGRSAADELNRRIFTPLSLTGTSLPIGPELLSPFARGYSFAPQMTAQGAGTSEGAGMTDWTALDPSVGWLGGGVVSTAADLHIWLQALTDGSLISDRLQQERLTFVTMDRDPGEPSYGYGLGIANYDGVIGHDGSILGYQAFAGEVAESGERIVVLANLDSTQDGIDPATEIARVVRGAVTATPAAAWDTTQESIR